MALAFFWLLSTQRLHAGPVRSPRKARAILLAAILGGVAAALVNGRLAGSGGASTLHAWLSLEFGSLGGSWGALAGAMLAAFVLRCPALAVADAMAPAILAGGAVARLGCLFTGCCTGVTVAPEILGAFQPLHLWPLYDMAALLVTFFLVLRVEQRPNARPGTTLVVFLVAYGMLRFAIEFGRLAPHPLGPFTSGQAMAALQAAAGLTLAASRATRA